jgi:hypothetical protein
LILVRLKKITDNTDDIPIYKLNLTNRYN